VFQLGRGHDSDLRINDISVSRRHASLEYRDDGFYIVDYQSKFGTLALLSDNVVVPEATHQSLQIGRTIVTIKAKIRSKVPEFTTNNCNISKKNKMKNVAIENSEFNNKLDGEDYKIVEIDGKRYLVKPEIESNEYDD
jgi:pSer/pThr/pTyr-binding forkhead associated (FHA) protein